MIHRTLLAGLCLALVTNTFASDWNQWRGPNRDGLAEHSPTLRDSLPEQGLQAAWISETVPSAGNGGWSSPVIADGKVYLYVHEKHKKAQTELPERKFPWLAPDKRGNMTDEEYAEYEKNRRDEEQQIAIGNFDFRETLYCFQLNNGQTVWKRTNDSYYTRFLQSATPAVIDGRVYVLGAGRTARCFDAHTGEELWVTRLPGEFRDEFMMSSFAVTDGVAVVLCGHLFGLDAQSGKILWEGDAQKTRGTHSSPVVWSHNEKTFILCNVAGNHTVCVEPKSGDILWSVDSQAGLSTPIVIDNRMITYGDSRKKGLRCFELSPEKATEVWVNTTLSDKGSSPVICNGYIYAQGERRLACVDVASGRTRWRTLLDLENPQYTSLIAADGKVFYAHDGVLCFEANPERFTPIFQAKIDDAGLLGTEQLLKEKHGIFELEKTAEGREKAAQVYNRKIRRAGPLRCSTPAFADGKLVLRLSDKVICYNLTAPAVLSRKEPE